MNKNSIKFTLKLFFWGILIMTALIIGSMALLAIYEDKYYYEYMTLDGETGEAVKCNNSSRIIPQASCMKEDGTRVYNLKSFKEIQK